MGQLAVDFAATLASMTGADVAIVHGLAAPTPERGEGMLHGGVELEDPHTAERRSRASKPSSEGVHFEHTCPVLLVKIPKGAA